MKKIFLLTLLMSQISLARPGHGDEVNNGADLAIQAVQQAYVNLEKYLYMSLSSERLNSFEKNLLQDILKALPLEKKNPQQLQFLSESQNPGFFIIDGQIKVAKTGNAIGSPIYFNLDLLYKKNNMNGLELLGYSEIIALLIHELGHHFPYTTEDHLILIETKIALYFQKMIDRAPLLPDMEEINLIVMNGKDHSSFPEVFIFAYDQVYNVSHQIQKELKCPLGTIHNPIPGLPDVSLSFVKPVGAVLYNIHWTEAKEKKSTLRFKIKGKLDLYCPQGTVTITQMTNYQLNIDFVVLKSDSGKKELSPRSVRVEQIYEPWWMFFQINL